MENKLFAFLWITKVIREKYGNALPFILKTDPVSRYYYFQKNDLIKITRRNGTITYRIVK
jgi:DNA-directed RNA polymerase subunit H (RpoH/RPB5)